MANCLQPHYVGCGIEAVDDAVGAHAKREFAFKRAGERLAFAGVRRDGLKSRANPLLNWSIQRLEALLEATGKVDLRHYFFLK